MKKLTAVLLAVLAATMPLFAQQERANARDTISAVVTRANPHAANATDQVAASTGRQASIEAEAHAEGVFTAVLRASNGRVKWQERLNNTVVTVGKNLALDTYLAGSSYTVTGPYMGLISSVSWSAINAADTMSSHSGWTEAGATNAPTYSGTRKTCAWSSASSGSKALSSSLVFTFTGAGTVKGIFVVFGSGAVNTIDNTSGTLYSAGLFAADRVVANGDTLTISYTASL